MAIKFPAWPFRQRKSAMREALATTSPNLKALTSEMYEKTHVGVIDLEEASKRSAKAKGPQNLSMAWDDDYVGMPGGFRTRDGGVLSERDRKDTYYQAYLNNPWVRACVQAIAKRFTSGKWELEETEKGEGSQDNYDKLYNLLMFVNEDEDFKQLLRAIAEDLGIFGESFSEIVPGVGGIPAQLHKIDCITMSTQFDKHGMVTKYVQSLDKSTETVSFAPEQIIRWWFPDPRASKKALSPIECIKDSVYLYTSMITWGEKFFKAGGKPVFSIEMGEDSNVDDASRYIKFFKENYMGIQNAHVPPVFYGGSKLVEFGKGSVELDFLQSLAWCRDEILSGYNTPLNVLGIQEAAHLGGGSGESANKIFVYNTVKPIEELILEKLNYRLVQKGFGIFDWRITVSHADYRDDQEIAKVQDMQIRNGSLTINEARQERGRMPVKGGDEAVIVAGKDILPVERNAEVADEQRQQAQLSLQGAKQAMQGQNQGSNTTNQNQQNASNQDEEEPEQGKKKEAQERSTPFEMHLTSAGEQAIWQEVWKQYFQKDVRKEDGSRAQTHTTPLDHPHKTSLSQAYEAYPDETPHKPYQASSLDASPYRPYQASSGQSASGSQASPSEAPCPEGEAAHQALVTQAQNLTQDAQAHQEASSEAQTSSRSQAPRHTSSEAPQSGEATCEALSPQTQEARDTQTPHHASYSPQNTRSSQQAQEDSGVVHWQDTDNDIQKALGDLRAQGKRRGTWKAHPTACDGCASNDGKTVDLGERFPSGAYIVPEHNRCGCSWVDAETGQEYEWKVDRYVLVSKKVE